jgi:hypothetical protein
MARRAKARQKRASARPARPVSTALRRLERQTVGTVVKQAKSLRADIERRVLQRGRELERRTEKMLARLERRISTIVGTTAKRLNLATQADVVRLQRQIAELERQLSGPVPTLRIGRAAAAAAEAAREVRQPA